MYTYELNYYPTKLDDGIYKEFPSQIQAINEFFKLEKKYPNRTGDAFIKVWKCITCVDSEHIKEIDLCFPVYE